MRFAVIADVHGNRWALEAVLDDIERRRCDSVLDLGDCVFGPLDPRGTAEILMNLGGTTVRGNQDRALIEDTRSDTLDWVKAQLTADQLAWFGYMPETAVSHDALLCHGTPTLDDRYLLEEVTDSGMVRLRDSGAVNHDTIAVEQNLILCAHSHVSRFVRLAPGRYCLNPGSVGLPAYRGDDPVSHAMEAGSPHARYAVVTRDGEHWNAEIHAVTYDWEFAAVQAEKNGRPDWAGWIRTGRAES